MIYNISDIPSIHKAPATSSLPFIVQVSDGSSVEVVRDSNGTLMLTLPFIEAVIKKMKQEDNTLAPNLYHSILMNGINSSTGEKFLDYVIVVQNVNGTVKVISSNERIGDAVHIDTTQFKPTVFLEAESSTEVLMDPTGKFKIPKVPMDKFITKQTTITLQDDVTTSTMKHSHKDTSTMLQDTTTMRTHHRKTSRPQKLMKISSLRRTLLPQDWNVKKKKIVRQRVLPSQGDAHDQKMESKHRRKATLPRQIIQVHGTNGSNLHIVSKKTPLGFQRPTLKSRKKLKKPTLHNIGKFGQDRLSKNPHTINTGLCGHFNPSMCSSSKNTAKWLPNITRMKNCKLRRKWKRSGMIDGLHTYSKTPQKTQLHKHPNDKNYSHLTVKNEDNENVIEDDPSVSMIGPQKPIISYESGFDFNWDNDLSDYTTIQETDRDFSEPSKDNSYTNEDENATKKVSATTSVPNVEEKNIARNLLNEDSKVTHQSSDLTNCQDTYNSPCSTVSLNTCSMYYYI